MNSVCEEDKGTIHLASRAGDLEAVRRFVEVEGVAVDCLDAEGKTPLTVAVEEESSASILSVVRYLVSKNANVEATIEGKASFTPLMIASSRGNIEVVEILLEEGGANINRIEPFLGNTALACACYRPSGFCAIPTLLQQGANVNPPRAYYPPPLMAACVHSNASRAIQQLLEYGADVDAQGGVYARTTMHVAAILSNETTIRMLIAHGGSINPQTRFGETLLWEAMKAANVRAVRVLLEHDAKVDILRNDGTSILRAVAIRGESLGIMGILLNHCRSNMAEDDFCNFLLQTGGSKDDIALHHVQTVEHAKLLIEQPRRQGKHLLPVCCAQLTWKNGEGLTPMTVAPRMIAERITSGNLPLMLEYFQSFESLPFAIPGPTSVSSSTANRRKLTDRIAVKLNPALNDFQWLVAEEAAQVVMGTTRLPEAITYAILGYLSPLDMMKRTDAAADTTV